MYLGAVANTTADTWVLEDGRMVESEVSWNPALLKMFDEIISNSVDEHIKSGKVKNIRVSTHVLTGEIVVEDDGGIPVQRHPEFNSYIPEMIFSEFRTGSNFSDDERSGAGMNGLGAKLTSVFSKEFKVETSDGKKKFVQVFRDNLSERGNAVVQNSTTHGTKITFTPDYDRLGCDLDQGNLKKIERRVYDVAGCNPKLKVWYNGKHIDLKSFRDYVDLFTSSSVCDELEDFTVAVSASSEESFKSVSFVNGVDTYNGGTHVDYVVNQITTKIREFIKKKHKVDVKPAVIKQQMFVFIKCRINAPMFTSQTKEFMSSEIRNYNTSYSPSDKFIKKVLESDVVQKVLDWVEGEKRRNELAELRKLNKTTQNTNFLKRIAKFDDATGKDRSKCVLALTEGDSAAKTILSARDPKAVGVFPLKGKLLNVRDIDVKKLTKNEEFQNIMAILGLKIGQKVELVDDLRFSKIVALTDQDPDGAHISGLLFNMIYTFWPELFTLGVMYRMNTPLIVAQTNGKSVEFFDTLSYTAWAEENPKHKRKYHKGLGGFDTKDFKRFLSEPEKYLVQITIEDEADVEALDIAFDKSKADARKEWLVE